MKNISLTLKSKNKRQANSTSKKDSDKEKNNIPKKSNSCIYIVSFAICLVAIAILYSNINRYNVKRLTHVADRTCEIYMHDTATLMEDFIQASLSSLFREMDNSYESFLLSNSKTLTQCQIFCKQLSSVNNSTYFAFIDEQGCLYNEDGINSNGNSLSFFYRIKLNETRIISVSPDINQILNIKNPNTITLATSIEPFEISGRKIIGMISVIDIEYLENRLNMDKCNNDTFYIASIIKSNGDYVMHNTPYEQTAKYTNHFKAFEENAIGYNGFNMESLQSNMIQRKKIFSSYTACDEKGYLYYMPINDSELYLLVYMPYRVMKDTISDINKDNYRQFSMLFFVAIAVILLLFVLYAHSSKKYITQIKNAIEETEQARKDADRANNAKSRFLSYISHDIRTPLNGIIGMTSIAKQGNDYSSRVNECLNEISVSSDHLLTLINDVLDMNKIESGKMECFNNNFYLSEIFTECSSIIAGLSKRKNINFICKSEVPENIMVYSDKVKLKQIIINILSNSVKYTDSDGQIIFTEKNIGFNNDNQIIIKYIIEDNGIGISEEYLDKIFDPFSQENTKIHSEHNGSGLGMSIVKNLVSLLGGTIQIKSKLGEGTKVTIDIPLEISSKYNKQIMDDTQGLACVLTENQKILVVEDNLMNMKIACFAINSLGKFEIVKAYNGKEAIELFKNSKEFEYSIIFMDIMMPEIDGNDATKIIRSMDRKDACSIPIIAMSANAFIDNIDKSHNAGMTDYITKPFDKSILKQTLYKYAKKYNK